MNSIIINLDVIIDLTKNTLEFLIDLEFRAMNKSNLNFKCNKHFLKFKDTLQNILIIKR